MTGKLGETERLTELAVAQGPLDRWLAVRVFFIVTYVLGLATFRAQNVRCPKLNV